jgi:hypothetical protein
MLYSAVKKGSLLMDSSTIDPNTAREVAKQATAKGVQMVRSPILIKCLNNFLSTGFVNFSEDGNIFIESNNLSQINSCYLG